MKFTLFITAALLLTGCGNKKAEIKTDKDSVSYAIGLDIGTTFQRQGIEVEPEAFLQGLKDVADTSSKRLMTDEQIRATMNAYQQKMMAKAREKMMQQSGPAKQEGEKFLAENKSKPGVVTTASGLQYKIIKAGNGKKPTADKTVRFHYRGSLLNGTEFDNSYKNGEPLTIGVGSVFPGLTQALQMMPVGSKWVLYVPAELGYGDQGSGPIPAGSTLIFEVELVSIVK